MRGLLPFLASRLVRAGIALWLVSTVVFVVMRLSGDPVPLLLPPDAPPSEIFRVRAELGLDRPLPVQYAVFVGNVLRGDFGRSIHFRQPAFNVVLGYLAAQDDLPEQVVKSLEILANRAHNRLQAGWDEQAGGTWASSVARATGSFVGWRSRS